MHATKTLIGLRKGKNIYIEANQVENSKEHERKHVHKLTICREHLILLPVTKDTAAGSQLGLSAVQMFVTKRSLSFMSRRVASNNPVM